MVLTRRPDHMPTHPGDVVFPGGMIEPGDDGPVAAALREAEEEVVHGILEPGDGGVIGVGRDGSIALVFNTEGMFRGAADSTGRLEVAIWE